MRVLGLTTVFPNGLFPKVAPFMKQQGIALARHCAFDMVAAIPWFPGARMLSRWTYWKSDLSKVPEEEVIDGLRVRHPRFYKVPRFNGTFAAATYAASLYKTVASVRGETDAVFATWAYPDGVAAVALGRMLDVPVVIQVIGSDINVVGAAAGPRRQLRWALPRAAGVVAVSKPLAAATVELGANREAVHWVPRGIDHSLFFPRNRSGARHELGLPDDARLMLFVGKLCDAKGIRELLDAFDTLAERNTNYRLTLLGDGPSRTQCDQRSKRWPNRLSVVGEVPHHLVSTWIAACDVLVLPSYNEGTPNVVLEALGSGRKVVATNVGGIPDFVKTSTQGELVEPRDAHGLARSLERVANEAYDPHTVAKSVELYDWDENARRVLAVIATALEERGRPKERVPG